MNRPSTEEKLAIERVRELREADRQFAEATEDLMSGVIDTSEYRAMLARYAKIVGIEA